MTYDEAIAIHAAATAEWQVAVNARNAAQVASRKARSDAAKAEAAAAFKTASAAAYAAGDKMEAAYANVIASDDCGY